MESYRLIQNDLSQEIIGVRNSNGWCIPFDLSNTDYQRFKLDLTNGAELQDADGNVMTAEQVQEFLETLP